MSNITLLISCEKIEEISNSYKGFQYSYEELYVNSIRTEAVVFEYSYTEAEDEVRIIKELSVEEKKYVSDKISSVVLYPLNTPSWEPIMYAVIFYYPTYKITFFKEGIDIEYNDNTTNKYYDINPTAELNEVIEYIKSLDRE